ADQADDAARRDAEAGAVERGLAAIGLAQAAGFDDGTVDGIHAVSPLGSRSLAVRPRRWIRSRTSGHSSLRNRSRSLVNSFFDASSVTYMPSPLRFSTSASSASSW